MTTHPEVETYDTVSHVIITDDGKIQFTTLEENDVKMVLIEAEKPMKIPLDILVQYVTDVYKTESKYREQQKNITDIITVSVLVYYVVTIIAIGMWYYYFYKGMAKIGL
jgi:hypothetical protein